MVIRFFVDLGMTPVQTYTHMASIERLRHVSTALVYKLNHYFLYVDGEIKGNVKKRRPKSVDEEVIIQVHTLIDENRRQTERNITKSTSSTKVQPELCVDWFYKYV